MDIFIEWFNHFIKKTHPTKKNPILLILAGHHTHVRNLEVILMAKENNVTILCLPPHTTHKLQPLDKCFTTYFFIICFIESILASTYLIFV